MYLKSEGAEFGGNVASDITEAEYTDCQVGGIENVWFLPQCLHLVAGIVRQRPVKRQNGRDGKFAHHRNLIRIVHANDGDALRPVGVAQDVIDARRDRENDLEIRQSLEQAKLGHPHQDVVDGGGIADVRMMTHLKRG